MCVHSVFRGAWERGGYYRYLSCSCTATTHLQELPEVTSLLIAGSFQTRKKLAIVDHLIRTQHSCVQVQKLGYIYCKFQIACQCDGSNQPINQNCQNLAYLL